MLGRLRGPKDARTKPKRVGRGPGSGHGKTSCRGSKGQRARSGGSVRPGFEGGQMPLQRRLPKRGFTNIFRKEYVLINVEDLNRFDDGSVITLETLRERGLVNKRRVNGVKILGNGELERRVVVHAHKFSASAVRKINERGGTVVEM